MIAKKTRPLRSDRHPKKQVPGMHRIDLVSAQLASSEDARDVNRDIVLELIRFRQPLARADLSRLSGLQPSTISAIVDQLLSEEWIEEGDVIKASRGRPSTMLALNSNVALFALDLRPDRAILAMVSLTGHFVCRETIRGHRQGRTAVEHIVARIRALKDEHPDKCFEGIGVAVPGRVHPETQQVLLAPNLKWGNIDLKRMLEEGTGLKVEIDNDANACLLSELWYGRLQGVRNVVLVAVAEGLGASILAGGQLQSGFNGLAGEFGHISVDPAGPRCGCGQRGCWEMLASSRAALTTFREAGGDPALRMDDLLALAEQDEAKALAALTLQAEWLGRGLRLITAALSPELILITGDITASWDRFGPIVEQQLAASMLTGAPPRLRIAGDAKSARLTGSAAMLMLRHTGYHLSNHVLRPTRGIAAPLKT